MKPINILILFLFTLNMGCATILSNQRQTIHLDSMPKGAEVRSNKLEHRAETPTAFSFHKGGDVYVTLSKAGYKEKILSVDRYVAPSFFANFLLLDLFPLGMVVDALSGSMWHYESAVMAQLEKDPAGLTEQQPGEPFQQPLQQPIFSSQWTYPKSNFSGPRLGFTYLNDEAVTTINEEGHRGDPVGNVITEFGWNFEKILFVNTDKKGMAFTIEIIPLIGGVDQNRFLPSITGLLGIRTENGMTFGMGPRLTHDDSTNDVITSLAYSGGINFKYDNVTIPLRIQFTSARRGTSISLLTGFSR